MTEPRRRRRRTLWAVLGVSAAAAVAAIGVVSASGSGRVPDPPALLSQPATAQDAIPADFTRVGGYPDITDLSRARLAGRTRTRAFYVVPGIQDQICVVATRGAGEDFIAASSCQPRARFDESPLVMGLQNDDGTADVAALSLRGPVTVDQGTGRSDADAEFAVLGDVVSTQGGVAVRDGATPVMVSPASLRPATVP